MHFHFPFCLLLLLMGYAYFFNHMIFITICVIYIISYKFYKNQITITFDFELITVVSFITIDSPKNILNMGSVNTLQKLAYAVYRDFFQH